MAQFHDRLVTQLRLPPNTAAAERNRILSLLEGAVVIVADNVAEYLFEHAGEKEEYETDDFPNVAPPFPRFFIEMRIPPSLRSKMAERWSLDETLASVGVLFASETESGFFERARKSGLPKGQTRPIAESCRWFLQASMFWEFVRQRPFGPVHEFLLGLTDEGRIHPDSQIGKHPSAFLDSLENSEDADEALRESELLAWSWLTPFLLTLTFMHCRNVTLEAHEPSPPLAKRHQKRFGRPLSRYYTLHIEPMKEILLTEGRVAQVGLRKALHICRGHFKDYRPGGGLFGKHRELFWWDMHVRGDEREGVVLKDYDIRLRTPGLGQPYRPADEERVSTSALPADVDPDSFDRATKAHAVTQNALADCLFSQGCEPRSPRADEPDYDLSWEKDGIVYVAEVKSIRPENEERQLRLGIGQVLRYRYLLERKGLQVKPVLAVEHQPTDGSWATLCTELGIALVWPETFSSFSKPEAGNEGS